MNNHSHTHFGDVAKQTTTRLAWSLILTLGFVFIEAAAGIIGNSLALLTDAAHNLTDVIALGLSWYAIRLTSHPADGRKTYGYHRLEILTALDLLPKRHVNARALSGGMRRRLLIGKALVHDPQVLFLDEPTAGVDVELRQQLWRYVRRLRERGTTVVLTTHYLEEAEELADRVAVIDRGRLVMLEDKRALMARNAGQRLQDIYVALLQRERAGREAE